MRENLNNCLSRIIASFFKNLSAINSEMSDNIKQLYSNYVKLSV